MFNKIHYTIANHTKPSGEKELVPRLKSGKVEEFMDLFGDAHQCLTSGTMAAALYALRDTLVEKMGNGTSIHLPDFGTFTLTLGGRVEVQEGKYVGSDVHVAGIRFTPDEVLLDDLRQLKVEQAPLPVRPYVDAQDLEAALADLFARQNTITRRDLSFALGNILSPHRLSDLLATLVKEGRLHREGTGSQTCYRKAKTFYSSSAIHLIE